MRLEIITAAISVITVGIAIGRIIYELSKTLTRLNCAVENLNSTLTDFTDMNEREHEELFGSIESLKDDVSSLKCENAAKNYENMQ